jgi:hypothetical protein
MMLNIRNHSLGKTIVYYLAICTALTLGVETQKTTEPKELTAKGLELSIIIPRTADRPDRTGKWQQKDDVSDTYNRVSIATVHEPTSTPALDRGIKTYWKSTNAESKWIVATSYEASQILNDYEKVSELVQGTENYKIILLNA